MKAYGHCFIFSLPYVLDLGLSCLAESGCIPLFHAVGHGSKCKLSDNAGGIQ